MEKQMILADKKNALRIAVGLTMAMMFLATSVVFQGKEQMDPALEESQMSVVDEEEILHAMSLRQKVYQMFIVTPEVLTDGANVTKADETMRAKFEECPVGGVVYFSKNLIDTAQTKQMLLYTQEAAVDIVGIPLFQCVDEEGERSRGSETTKVSMCRRSNRWER